MTMLSGPMQWVVNADLMPRVQVRMLQLTGRLLPGKVGVVNGKAESVTKIWCVWHGQLGRAWEQTIFKQFLTVLSVQSGNVPCRVSGMNTEQMLHNSNFRNEQ